MTDQVRRCPNGHPALFAGEGFCEVCGAPLGVAVAPPAWGQPQAPMPPQGQPGWGAPPPQAPQGWGQQPAPPAWGQPGASMPPQVQPGWGAPPPQGWAPQGQPAWGAPPPKKGGGCGRLLFILLLLLLLGGGAYVLVAKPSWSPLAAKASATPGLALPTPKSSGPASSKTPAPLISVDPGGSAGLPTSAPTAAATAGATTSTGDLQSCRAEKAGIDVSYPMGWYTVSGFPDWNCMLFDRNPIEILPNTELPIAAIQISQETRDYATVVEDFKTNTVYELIGSDTGTVDGLDATALEVNNTGVGYFEKGVHQLVVVVDRGSRGCLILEVIGKPGADFDANSEILGTVIDNLKIDQ